jgi:hypothetical protein
MNVARVSPRRGIVHPFRDLIVTGLSDPVRAHCIHLSLERPDTVWRSTMLCGASIALAVAFWALARSSLPRAVMETVHLRNRMTGERGSDMSPATGRRRLSRAMRLVGVRCGAVTRSTKSDRFATRSSWDHPEHPVMPHAC